MYDYVDENYYSLVNKFSDTDKAFIKYAYEFFMRCFSKKL